MHPSSYDGMAARLQCLLGTRRHEALRVLDVGSQDINGTYRPLIVPPWTYTGTDIAQGRNVDLVMDDDLTIPGAEWDAILCGQTLEHCRNPHTLTEHMALALRRDGLLFLTAPAEWPTHRHPLDCWRIKADGMRALLEHAGLLVVEVSENNAVLRAGEARPRSPCVDCWGIGRKP